MHNSSQGLQCPYVPLCTPTVFWYYAYNQSTDVSLHSPFYRPLIRCVCPQKPTLSPIYTALFQVVKSLSLYSQTFQTSSEIFTYLPVAPWQVRIIHWCILIVHSFVLTHLVYVLTFIGQVPKPFLYVLL